LRKVKFQSLCRAEEVVEGGGRGFRFGCDTEQVAVFVVRKNGMLYAYHNRCPHMGAPLDWQPDRFFDRGGERLLYSTHGARFRPEDGFCIAGPCAGASLAPAAIVIEDGMIALEDDLLSP
jgi:nitrite reductase/ring-hydroxylating ferredoxin subunit